MIVRLGPPPNDSPFKILFVFLIQSIALLQRPGNQATVRDMRTLSFTGKIVCKLNIYLFGKLFVMYDHEEYGDGEVSS